MEEHPEPLVLSLPCPRADVYDLYQRIALPGRPGFLLESGLSGSARARYSFFGSDPYLVFSGRGSRYSLQQRDHREEQEGDPFIALMRLLRSSRQPRSEGVPPFFGGAVGYFCYDLVRGFERLPAFAVDDLRLPDLEFAFVDLVAALDHHRETLHLIFAPPLPRMLGEPREKLYQEGRDRLASLEAKLAVPHVSHYGSEPPFLRLGDIQPEQSKTAFLHRVGQCQDWIRAGDIYQANLSHRFTFEVPQAVPHLARKLYGRARIINPSPFSGLLEFPSLCLVSSSPERLVHLDGSQVETRPIAGTRPRGQTMLQDRLLAEDLLLNSKERAEHLMLVDLERNDLGRVCRYGSIHVNEFMEVERYSHVSHIVSNIAGQIREGLDGFDVLRAMFPGGTITGVPKIRCMEIIETLEPVRRGPYTGSMGYLSWSGDLDFNIIIRTILLTGSRGYFQVGAGIVADSKPDREYEETLFKAEALLKTLRTP